MNIDDIVAASRPTPLPDEDVVARHRATLDRRVAAGGPAASGLHRQVSGSARLQMRIVDLDDSRRSRRSHGSRHRLIGAVAATVVAITGVAGGLALRSGVEPPLASDIAAPTAAPTAAPASTTVAPFDPTVGPLLTAPVPAEVQPLVTINEPGWTLERYSGFNQVPDNDITATCAGCTAIRMVLAADGPLFGGPIFTAWTFDGDFEYPSDGLDTPVTITGIAGRMSNWAVISSLASNDSQFTEIAWPLSSGRWAFVEAYGFAPERAVELAASLTFASPVPSLNDVPAGFSIIAPSEPIESIDQVSLRFVSGERSVEISAANAGLQGLLDWRQPGGVNPMRTGWTPLVLDGATVAFFDPSTDWQTTGKFATWVAGSWSYSVDGYGFGSDDAFLDVVSQLELTDAATFEVSSANAESTPIQNWFES